MRKNEEGAARQRRPSTVLRDRPRRHKLPRECDGLMAPTRARRNHDAIAIAQSGALPLRVLDTHAGRWQLGV